MHREQFMQAAFIGTLFIDPTRINVDGTYVVECPVGTKFLTVGMIGDDMVVYVMAPDVPTDEKYLLRIVAGGSGMQTHIGAVQYIGSAVIPNAGERRGTHQDWHVFHDRFATPDPVHSTVQSRYKH